MQLILRNNFKWRHLAQQVFKSLVKDVESKPGSRPILTVAAAAPSYTNFTNVRFYAEQQSGAARKASSSPGKDSTGDKKAVNKDKITLHALDGSVLITSLDDATKLAKRRGLKLVKETDFDGKSQRPVYKLITIAKIKLEEQESHGQTKNVSASSKGDKMLNISNKIADHDLQSRLKHIEKWLAKQQKVIVVISGTVSDLATSEKIFKQMEEVSQGKGRIVQKRSKGSEIRFQILPAATAVPQKDVTAKND